MELEIKHTSQYSGVITVNGEAIATLTQSFDQEGHLNGSTGIFISNKDKYYSNLTECRAKEDEFRSEMRKIEDKAMEE